MCKIVKTLYFRRDAIRFGMLLKAECCPADPQDLFEIADIDTLADSHAGRCADCETEQKRRRDA